MPGASCGHLLVLSRALLTAGIAGNGARDAGQMLIDGLHAPETATRQNRDLLCACALLCIQRRGRHEPRRCRGERPHANGEHDDREQGRDDTREFLGHEWLRWD
jgi:hypothetical protein